ncbi:hypothetical protein O6H91_15G084000 [Diphasiastrum complanatum]|uniref:Uncharacterized protein n=1 Tax=Diphasiastrum complanatum TaxID=34168 RepID=A0ACC2BK85_DIPCM|nr:hypothetical protein O6H91_15G084000 [Diphasiastrum complanatum]
MAYVSAGTVKGKRPWSLSMVIEIFWAVLFIIRDYFVTMFSIEATEAYRKRASASGGRGGGGGGPGGGGPYGGGRGPSSGSGGGFRGMDNVRGIDHDAPAPCGSCCGG